MFYMFFAEGFEEVEAIATLDVIRRAGIDIKSVAVKDKIVTGSHGVPVVCDLVSDEITADENLEGIILPGGMPGSKNLDKDETVNKFIDYCNTNNKFLCAICAAPFILGKRGILNGRKATCFPGFENELTGAKISDKFVCIDKNTITGRGMGSAVKFGLAIVSAVKGQAAADKLEATLQCS